MADYAPRSYLRSSNGPQRVEYQKDAWSCNRQTRDTDDRHHRRSKKSPNEKKSRSRNESSIKQRSNSGKPRSETPVFHLDVLSQPSSSIVLGMEVEMTVLLSVRYADPDHVPRCLNYDTARLLAVASLAAESRAGERVAMESASLAGTKPADSLHQTPRPFEEAFRQSHPCRLVLGYFSLSELTIRQPGNYRLRATVIQAPAIGVETSSPSIIAMADSQLIKVDRWPAPCRSRLA